MTERDKLIEAMAEAGQDAANECACDPTEFCTLTMAKAAMSAALTALEATHVVVPREKTQPAEQHRSLAQIENERALCDSLNVSYPDWASNAAYKRKGGRP